MFEISMIIVGLVQPFLILAFLIRRPSSEIYLTSLLPYPNDVLTVLFISLTFNFLLIMATWASGIIVFVILFNFVYTLGGLLVELR